MSTNFGDFVPRARHLEQLSALLERALSGEGQVCFVTGEAGAGKTSLIQAFTRAAQDQFPDLLVVFGDCNAQTGAGDPYLPFREVLGQLSGETDASVAEGVITQENAQRLRAFLRESGDVLIDVGADVLGIFVPGASLLARIGARLLGIGKPEHQAALGQKEIFEQYTEIIRRLTQHRPLIIMLDDLHWVDGASVDLLFHLSRRIEGSRVLIIGTYRPQDLALGRSGERHPLEPVLSELKRYYGDAIIAIEHTDADEQRLFLDALIDSRPNRLDAAFRTALLRHTEGHPLFLVELLRSFQEQGVLAQDSNGFLVLAGKVDWNTLPSRAEGVIESRIGRLHQPLREVLTIGSVEGETFAGEVVARVQDVAERDVIRQLSGELEKQHQLVAAQGAERIGATRISYYRFRHNLFQKYLYGTLDPVERAYLHEDVGQVLEELYGERAESIAVQLAHHFGAAGNAERAAHYGELAGDAASAAYAYGEARLHYVSSLRRLTSLDGTLDARRRRVAVTTKLARVSYLVASPEETLHYLRDAEPVAAALAEESGASADRLLLARVHYWIGRYLFMVNAPKEAITFYRRVLEASPSLGDAELIALPSSVIGRALVSQGYFAQAVPLLRQAVEPLEAIGGTVEWIHTLGFLCSALAGQGEITEALQWSDRALARAREIRSLTHQALSYVHRWAAYMQAGDVPGMLEVGGTLVASAEEAGDHMTLYVGLGFLAWSHAAAGQFQEALATMQRCRARARDLGAQLVVADWFASVDAEIALGLGRPADAAQLAAQAVTMARSLDGVFAEIRAQRVWGQALAATDAPPDDVDAHLASAVRAAEAGGAWPEAARTEAAWAELCEARRDRGAAFAHYRQAAQRATRGMAAEWRGGIAKRLRALRRSVNARDEG